MFALSNWLFVKPTAIMKMLPPQSTEQVEVLQLKKIDASKDKDSVYNDVK